MKLTGVCLALALGALSMLMIGGVATATAGGALCSTATNPCSSKWATGTVLDFSLKSGSTAVLTSTSGSVLDKCTSSTVKGKLSSNPGGSGLAESATSELTWGGCTVTTDTLVPGGLKIESGGSGTGKVVSNALIEITVNIFGGCTYGDETGVPLGTVSEGSGTSVVFTANAVVERLNFNWLCPETAKFVAEYVLTSPSSTTHYVSSS